MIMKKIIKIFSLFLTFFLFNSFSFASNINSEIKIVDKENEKPIENMVIIKSDSFKNETRYLVTDKT